MPRYENVHRNVTKYEQKSDIEGDKVLTIFGNRISKRLVIQILIEDE